MTEPREEIESALDTAIERVREAEEHFLELPDQTSERVDAAHVVEHRAEDVEELAVEARSTVEEETSVRVDDSASGASV